MVIETLVGELKSSGLADQPGKLLYSGVSTLRAGDLYLLGYNPGGDPQSETDSILSHLCRSNSEQNEYLDARWRPGGRLYPPGAAPMQKRVAYTLHQLRFDVQSVCASNLIFVRSTGIENLTSANDLANACWQLHRLILDIVQPKHIVVLGEDTFNYVRSRGRARSAIEQYPSGHGSWNCKYVQLTLQQRECDMISVPHLSRHAISNHPDVCAWMRQRFSYS
jgi:hypothetical protein